MTHELSCHHGHRFEAPLHAGGHAVCPLCGAVTSFDQTDVETKGDGSAGPTINLRNSAADGERAPLTTSRSENPGKTLVIDPNRFPDPETLKTAFFDRGETGDAPSPEAELDMSGGRTIAYDMTSHADGSHPVADDAQGEGVVKADALSHAPSEDGSIIESGRTIASRAPKTATISKTVSLNHPPQDGDLTDESPGVKPLDLPGYLILGELGRGGMGVVYRARDEKRSRDVALKTLLHISPLELQRFKQEFRSLADIAHPNLAVLHELLSHGEAWCFSMEILDAVDFTEYVWSGFEALHRKNGRKLVGGRPNGGPRLSPEITQRLVEGLKQLVLGLNALHQAGMLHRDIKPSNVLVTTEGRLVLVDFGLASQFEEGSAERPTGIHGTPEYMAPEQAACDALSPASDWYAVGVMLYEVLTGRFPIAGSPLQIIFKKRTETPKAPRELEPSVPEDLNDLCFALLDKDPAKRPKAADVLRCIGAEDLIDELTTTAPVRGGHAVELVGREVHLQCLRTSFRQVIGGMTKSIFVHGRSGMGKSVLIHKFLEGLRQKDQAVVLSGRCYEQESVPFKALDNLIDSLADYLVGLGEEGVRAATPVDLLPLIRLFPVLGRIPGASDAGRPSIENVDQPELRQRAMNALRELLRRLGQRKPMVLYIDDLQWGDEDSADLLADLVRPPHAPRVLVLGSYRTEDRDKSLCLKALEKAYTTGQQHPHREKMAVESLQEEDAERLALMLLGRDDKHSKEMAGKIARESRGWPFFVWELAQHVQDFPETADQSLDLDEVIWIRVNRLPEAARKLLELIAVKGRPIPAREAYQAIDALEKGQGLLAQLRTRHFVRSTEAEDEDTHVEMYHDRIRESVVTHLSCDAIKGYSLQLASTIEAVSGIQVADLWTHINSTSEYEEPGPPYVLGKQQWQRVFDLAYHFDAAGEHQRAFPFALCAAEQARKQDAQEVAEQQFRIALRGEETVKPALRFRVHEGLGDVLVYRANYDGAKEQFEAARTLADDNLVLARLDGKLGESAFKRGDMGAAREYLEKALTAIGENRPSRLMVMPSLAKEAIIQVLHSLFPSRFVGRRDPNSPKGQMDLFRARIYITLTQAHWFISGMHLCLWAHLRQMNLAERYPPGKELGPGYAFHAIVMTALPLANRGIAYAEKAYQISLERGDLWGRGKARSFHTFSCIVLSRFREGLETGTEAVRLLEQAGDIWEANMARMIATVPMYHLGDLKTCYREAKKAYEIGRETGDYSAVCISLMYWVTCAPHLLPVGAIQQELGRKREDPLSSTAAILARGLELLLREDNLEEAVKVLQESQDYAKKQGIRNVCIFPGVTWKATCLRMIAERQPDGAERRRAVKTAWQGVRKALKTTRCYSAFRAHALREAGIIAAMQAKEGQARRFFAESLAVAVANGARYDIARTNLARGQAGLTFGWPDAEKQVAEAQSLIAEIENVEVDT